jgi:hypothetical protein
VAVRTAAEAKADRIAEQDDARMSKTERDLAKASAAVLNAIDAETASPLFLIV